MKRNNYLLNQDGFSVVEMITAIAIAGMIMGVIGFFLTVHIKSYKVTDEVTNVQYEGQLVLNQMVKMAMESKGIDTIDNNITDLDSIYEITPFLVVFKRNDGGYDTFFLNSDKKILYYQNFDDETGFNSLAVDSDVSDSMKKMGRYIESLTIEPYEGVSFKDTPSVEISLAMKDGDVSYTASTEVKFRNK